MMCFSRFSCRKKDQPAAALGAEQLSRRVRLLAVQLQLVGVGKKLAAAGTALAAAVLGGQVVFPQSVLLQAVLQYVGELRQEGHW